MDVINGSINSKYNGKKILVADKELITALDLKYSLEYFGLTVLPIINQGAKLLIEALNEKPNLIITDTQLDGKDNGVTAILNLTDRFNIPYIFLTTSSEFNYGNYSKRLNPLAVMQKPIDYTKLLFYINKCLLPPYSESIKRVNIQSVSSNG